MSIARTKKTANYTTISNALIADKSLSWRAKGIAVYLLSKPDDWQIIREDIEQYATDGIASVRAGLKELEDAGYLTRTRKIGAHGHFEWDIVLHEAPQPSAENQPVEQPPSADLPPVVNPPAENPPAENRTLLNTDVLKTDLPMTDNQKSEGVDDLTEPTQPPAPPPLPATNVFGTKLDDARMCYDDPPTGPKTPPPVPEKPRPRRHERVTSPHLDPRKFKNGFVVAGEGATAVEVYYERFAIGDDKARLSAPLEDDLIAHCPDLDRLRSVIEAYSRTAYKPRNMQLIFDWYAKGITQNGQEKKAYDHRKQPTTRPEPAHARPDLYEQFGWNATATASA